ncbi:TPA: hypothetical protein DIC40_07745 [Patescibacteria group bacterium]|nr:hypothetical protein [Candidatus Gracilibacteria bacterium]
MFDGTIEKDLLIAGGNIIINSNTTIKGETKIAGGKIDFAGTANNVDLNAGEILLKGTIK